MKLKIQTFQRLILLYLCEDYPSLEKEHGMTVSNGSTLWTAGVKWIRRQHHNNVLAVS